MKIEKENNKRAFQVNFRSEGGKPDFEILFAGSKGDAFRIAIQAFAGRKIKDVEVV